MAASPRLSAAAASVDPMLPFRSTVISHLPLPWAKLTPHALLSRWFATNWISYAVGIVAMLLTNITEVAVPKITQLLIDQITLPHPPAPENSDVAALRGLLISIILVLSVQAIGRRYWRLSLGQETHRIASTLKESIWLRARYLPRHRLERDLSAGALMNVATGDVSNGRLIFGWTLIGLFDFIFLTGFAAVAMVAIDPVIAALSFAAFVTLPLLTYRAAQREYRQHAVAQEQLGRLNDLVAQAVASIKLQRLSQSEGFWTARLMRIAEEYRRRRLIVVDTMLQFMPLTGIPALISHSVLLLCTIPAVIRGDITVGEFVALQGYIVLLQSPLGQLGLLVSEWQRGRASLERVTNVLRVPAAPGFEEATTSPVRVPRPNAPIFSVQNLSFRYPEAPTSIISDLSLEIAPGERLGITGPVGSGKTTFLNILAGNERTFAGRVLLHGHDIRSYTRNELARAITLVEQRPFLFAESIRRNVLLDRSASDADVQLLLDAAGLGPDLARFPRGLDTPLGEWGINLSGGQKQRLTIARALAAHPAVLLLDDCLSAVDVSTEERILENLNRLLPTTTIVWVAHRHSTLRLCSRIVRFPQ